MMLPRSDRSVGGMAGLREKAHDRVDVVFQDVWCAPEKMAPALQRCLALAHHGI
jgi:hypothetical protein